MRDFIISELSQWSGLGSEGYIWGGVDPSTYKRVLIDSHISDNVFAIRKDVGVGSTFQDLSVDAVSEIANSFAPWGTTAQFGAADKLYIACNNSIAEIYVDIDTPGVWTGDGLEVGYSSAGVYDDKQLTGFTDGSNGFRAANGVYKITIPWPTDIVEFSPQPGSAADIAAGRAVASRKWLVLYPKNLSGSPSAAPLLRRVWLAHTDNLVSYTDITSSANSALTPAPPENNTLFFPTVGSAVYYVTDTPAYAEDRYIFKAQAANRTRKMQYLSSNDTWKDFSNVIDPSADFTQGPTAYQTTSQQFLARWDIPTDWASKQQTLGSVTETGYWRRVLTMAVSQQGPMLPVTTVVRARRFGAGVVRGLSENTAFSLSRFKISRLGTRTSGSIVGIARNMHTGQSATFTIPAPYVIGEYILLSQSLSVAVGQQWDIAWSSGGQAYDVHSHWE